VDLYLRALQCDVQGIRTMTGLHISQYILWPEVRCQMCMFKHLNRSLRYHDVIPNLAGNGPCSVRDFTSELKLPGKYMIMKQLRLWRNYSLLMN